MNILHASPRYLPAVGGAEKHLHEFSKRLVVDRHRVQVLTTDALDPDSFWNPAHRRVTATRDVVDGVEVVRSPIAYFPASAMTYRGIRRGLSILSDLGAPCRLLNHLAALAPRVSRLEQALRESTGPYDVIAGMNIAYEGVLIPAQALAERSHCPWVIFPLTHLGNFAQDKHIRKFYTMRHQLALVHAASAVFTQTKSESRFFSEAGVDAGRLIRLGPGVNPDELSGGDTGRARARWDLQGPIVLFIGTLSEDKGAPALLEAMSRLWAQGDRTSTLVLAGTPLADWHSAFSRQPREVQARVRVLPRVPDSEKNDLLAVCTLLALPSRVDSFGIVLLEAWLYGKPVIGADAGGIPDVISDRHDGLLVPYGDAHALASAIRTLFCDPAVADAMGREGRSRVLAQHTWEIKYKVLRDVYERVVAHRPLDDLAEALR